MRVRESDRVRESASESESGSECERTGGRTHTKSLSYFKGVDGRLSRILKKIRRFLFKSTFHW